MTSPLSLLIGFPSLLQYVLAVGSSVFGAMFYGDLAEGQSEIHIPDVEPAAFLILLKWVWLNDQNQWNQGGSLCLN